MHSSGDHWRLGRRPGLDGLRGVAIGLVLVSHLFAGNYLNAGPIGVTVFFVLSGFLITSLLLEHSPHGPSDRALRTFYARRARRLLPALVAVLVLVTGIDLWLGVPPWGALIVTVVYVANWASALGQPMFMFGHMWSLAIEEQFYLIWPVVLLIALQRRVPVARLARWCGCAALACLGLRFGLYAAGMPSFFLYYATFSRADALLLGCALSCALYAGVQLPRMSNRVALLSAGVLLGGGLLPGAFAHDIVGPTLGLATAPVLLAVVRRPGWLGRSQVLRYLGSRSYGLYLWHAPVVYGLQWVHKMGDVIWERALGMVLAVVIAELSWRFVEQPFLRARKRTPSPALVVAASTAR